MIYQSRRATYRSPSKYKAYLKYCCFAKATTLSISTKVPFCRSRLVVNNSVLSLTNGHLRRSKTWTADSPIFLLFLDGLYICEFLHKHLIHLFKVSQTFFDNSLGRLYCMRGACSRSSIATQGVTQLFQDIGGQRDVFGD